MEKSDERRAGLMLLCFGAAVALAVFLAWCCMLRTGSEPAPKDAMLVWAEREECIIG